MGRFVPAQDVTVIWMAGRNREQGPYVPGSFDDVVLAYDLGRLDDQEYEFLAGSAACPAPERS